LARHAESGSRRWAAAAIAACAAGMASKEVMVVAPLVALLYDRTFFAGNFRAVWQARGRVHTALFATWIWLGWLMFSSHLAARGVGFGQGMNPGENVLVQAQAVFRYLRLAWWPDGLVFDYGWSFGGDRPQALLALAGCVAVVGATLWAVARRPTLGFAAAWVLLLLAPTSTFIPIVQQPVAESRMYLPLAGDWRPSSSAVPCSDSDWPGSLSSAGLCSSRRSDSGPTPSRAAPRVPAPTAISALPCSARIASKKAPQRRPRR
jgi:hypothetical protein